MLEEWKDEDSLRLMHGDIENAEHGAQFPHISIMHFCPCELHTSVVCRKLCKHLSFHPHC